MQRGNQIRSNYIHGTKGTIPGADTRGIMLDDQLSGVHIEHNVFVNASIIHQYCKSKQEK